MDLAELVETALALVPPSGRALLGLAGAPGAGKSTLAEVLVAEAIRRHGPSSAVHVPMDGFHLTDVQLERLGLLARKGVPETFDPDGYAALLRRLRTETERPAYAPGFERVLEQPLAGAVVIPPEARLVVTEGNYLLLARPEWRAVRQELDAVWWVEAGDEAVRRERLVARHTAYGKSVEAARAWVGEVDEANARLVADGRDRADRIVVVGRSGPLESVET